MDKRIVASVLKLPVGQKIALAGELWDSLEDADIQTPPELRRELRQRLAKYRRNPGTLLTVAELRKKSAQVFRKARRRTA